MGVASGCGEQEVGVASGSGWNLWVWLLGVVVRRYIDFLILLIPTPLVSVLFTQHPYFLFILLNVFRSCHIVCQSHNVYCSEPLKLNVMQYVCLKFFKSDFKNIDAQKYHAI